MLPLPLFDTINTIQKEIDMANMINLNIDIPSNKKDVIAAFKGLIVAFKNDIKVRETKDSQVDTPQKTGIETSHGEFFSKYVGAFDDSGFVSDQDLKDARSARFAK